MRRWCGAVAACLASLVVCGTAVPAAGKLELGVLGGAARFEQLTGQRVYYSGRPGSPWDLATKPRSRAAYRALITPLG